MNGLLAQSGLRFYSRRPWQLFLAVSGIALGVAVYVGVDLANDSARRAFELSSDLITGSTTHHLMGTRGEIADSLYRSLRMEHGPIRAAPVIEDEVRLRRLPDRVFTLMGVDPLEETGFRGFAGFVPGRGTDFTRLIVEPGAVLVPDPLLEELGLELGAEFELLISGQSKTVRAVGTVLDTSSGSEGPTAPIIADIATAQELLGSASLSRVDLVLDEAEAERIRTLGLPGATLVPAEGRNAAFDELARAFRINLTALSLLALLVGVFLIYATMSFAVVQRRGTFGVLRAIGVSRRQLLTGVLGEALALGAVATTAGILLGQQLAEGLVELVLRTVGDLYFESSVSAATPSATIYWRAFALGLGMTLLAAAAPALDAARSTPNTAMSRAALERSTRLLARRATWLALPAAAVAATLLLLSSRSLVLAFAGLFFVIATGALMVPAATRLLARLAEPLVERAFGISGSLAARGMAASLSRTGVATAALSVAVATVVGIGLMIGSFRISVEDWLTGTLTADVYVNIDGEQFFDDSHRTALSAIAGVRGSSLTRFIRLPTAAGEVSLRALDPGPDGWGLRMTAGGTEAVARMESAEGILVSEPLAYHRQLQPGDNLILPTVTGETAFTILGVFRDYSTNGGTVLMPLNLYRSHWADDDINGIGVYLDDEIERQTILGEMRGVFGAGTPVRFRSNDFIRERSMAIFDRTFRITEVLRILAGVVAFFGLASAVMSIELERGRELAVLRALGLRPRQVQALTLAQTGLLGLAAGLFAIPLGIAMAALLIEVINVRSFGWSMDLAIAAQPLALGVVLALSAAVLAGIYPAVRAVRVGVAGQLREE